MLPTLEDFGLNTNELLVEQVRELTAQVIRLRAALEPFAEAMALAESAAVDPYSPDQLLEDCRAHVTLYEFAVARRAHAPPAGEEK